MICKVHNRERISPEGVETLERRAIYFVRKVINAYRRRCGRDIDICYVSLDIQEDLTVAVYAYSCAKDIAVLAPQSLAEFSFRLRYEADTGLVRDAQDVKDWHQTLADQIYKSAKHWEGITAEDLQRGTRAEAAAYLLHKMSRTGRSMKDCVALLKVTGLDERQT